MTEFDYLEYEYYDAQAKWRPASTADREVLRDHLIRLSRRAELEPKADGPRLAEAMRRLASVIEEQLRPSRNFVGIPEDFQLTYAGIKLDWRRKDDAARLHMLAQITEMGQRRDIDPLFLMELTTLHGQIQASLRS